MKEFLDGLRTACGRMRHGNRIVAALTGALLLHFFAAPAQAGPTHEVVTSFQRPPQSPGYGSLVLGPDGCYWGTTPLGGALNYGTVYKVNASTGALTTVVEFTRNGTVNKGSAPYAGLVSDGQGNFWGTTCYGGALGYGTVFKLNAATGALTTVAEFTGNGASNKGANPLAGLVGDGAGNFWGTTHQGGAYDSGTVYKIDASTGALTTLAEFSGNGANNRGANPLAVLASDGAGFFWGTTTGGALGYGTVFKVDAATGALTTVVEFTNNAPSNRGTGPYGGLVRDGAGFFWGTTVGGALGYGTVFKVNAETGALTTVVEFSTNGPSNKGDSPIAGLVSDGAGNFWGTTSRGGASSNGTVYKVNASTGALTTVVEFTNNGASNKGGYPQAGLASDGAGNLWGTTYQGGALGKGTVYKLNAGTGALTTMAEFTSDQGAYPYAGPARDKAGNFWGTTYQGGALGYGTVYKVDAGTGARTTVVEFTGNGASNKGANPWTGLASDGAGNFWGTTSGGGASGNGTVYKVNAGTGALTTVVEFGASNKGANPWAGLVSDGAGNFWGTTYQGGAFGNGTVYKVNASTGALTTVVEFGASNKGAYPQAGLVSDGAGFFWGTTSRGGAYDYGTVYKVNASTGALTTVVEFTSNGASNKGAHPSAGLVSDGAGFFWGTTGGGGASNYGTVYKVNASTGALTTLVQFPSHGAGKQDPGPAAGLVSDGAGFFWGTTSGSNVGGDYGTVFKVSAETGALTTVVEFTRDGPQANSGANPGYGALLKHTDGNFYGTTVNGGPAGGGTVFRLRFGAAPVTQPASGVALSGAVLNGTVNPNDDGAAAASFQYGTSPALSGAETVSAGTVANGSSASAVSVALNGLLPHTTYYYRVVASNAGNSVPQQGTIQSFTTLNTAPVAPDGTASATTGDAKSIVLPFPATDADGDAVTLVSVTPGAGLTVNSVSSSEVTFTPDAAFAGASSLSYAVKDGFGGTASGTITVTVSDNDAPTIDEPAGGFSPLTLRTAAGRGGTAALPDYRSQAAAYDAVGVQQVSQSPAPGAALGLGGHEVTLTVKDAAGNSDALSFTVTVLVGDPVTEPLFTKGAAVPGAGVPGRGIPAEATWNSFGVPALNGAGELAFVASLTLPPRGTLTGVFAGPAEAPVLLVKTGDPAPGTNGATFASFKDPLFNEEGRVAFVATLAGAGVTGANNCGIWTNARGADAAVFELLARKGGPVPGVDRARWKSFSSVALASGELNLVGTVAGGATSASDLVLCRYAAGTPGGELLLREGWKPTPTSPALKSFAALANVSGSPGQRRQPLDGGLHVRTTWSDGRTRLFNNIGAAGVSQLEAATGDDLVDEGGQPLGTLASLGIAADASGSAWGSVFRAGLAGAGTSSADNAALVGASADGLSVLARKGEEADPLRAPGALIQAFAAEPVASEKGCAAVVTLSGNGISRPRDTALLWRGNDFRGLLAREGDAAPGGGGAVYGSFVSIALPDGATGPIFVAKLLSAKTGEPSGRVTARNDLGLWAADSSGGVRLLLRKGDPLNGKIVTGFVVLPSVSGSAAQARSYNDPGEIVAKVIYADRAQALVRFLVP